MVPKTMFAKLKTKVDELKENKDFSMQFCAFDEDENCPFILALITPLMRRVHEMVGKCTLFSNPSLIALVLRSI